jgi:hypothetical protein
MESPLELQIVEADDTGSTAGARTLDFGGLARGPTIHGCGPHFVMKDSGRVR